MSLEKIYHGEVHVFTSITDNDIVTIKAGPGETLVIEGINTEGGTVSNSDIVSTMTSTELNFKDPGTLETKTIADCTRVGTGACLYDLESDPNVSVMIFTGRKTVPGPASFDEKVSIQRRTGGTWTQEALLTISNVSTTYPTFVLDSAIDSYSGSVVCMSYIFGAENNFLIYKKSGGSWSLYQSSTTLGSSLHKPKVYGDYIVGCQSNGNINVYKDSGTSYGLVGTYNIDASRVTNNYLFDFFGYTLGYIDDARQIVQVYGFEGTPSGTLFKNVSDTGVLTGISIAKDILIYTTTNNIYICGSTSGTFRLLKVVSTEITITGCCIASTSLLMVNSSSTLYFFVKNFDTWYNYKTKTATFTKTMLSASGLIIANDASTGQVDYYPMTIRSPETTLTTSTLDVSDQINITSMFPFLVNSKTILNDVEINGSFFGDKKVKFTSIYGQTIQSLVFNTYVMLTDVFTVTTGSVMSNNIPFNGGYHIDIIEDGIYDVYIECNFAINSSNLRKISLWDINPDTPVMLIERPDQATVTGYSQLVVSRKMALTVGMSLVVKAFTSAAGGTLAVNSCVFQVSKDGVFQ